MLYTTTSRKFLYRDNYFLFLTYLETKIEIKKSLINIGVSKF